MGLRRSALLLGSTVKRSLFSPAGQGGSGSPSKKPATPTNLAATGGFNSVSFTWTPVTGVAVYDLYQGTSSGTETLAVSGIEGSYYNRTGLSSGTRYYFYIKARNADGTSSASSEVNAYTKSSLLVGLANYDAFSSGAFLVDSSGNGNTLTNNNTVTQAAGILGQAANFVAASSQFLNVNDNPTIDFRGMMSLSLWANFTTVSVNQCLISKGLLSTDLEWAMQCVAANNIRFDIGDPNGGDVGIAAATTITSGSWFHIAIVYDGSQTGNAGRLKMWINGVAQTLTFIGTIPATNTPGTNPLFIGDLGGAVPQYTNGLIDELGLWDVALTSGQIASLYNGGVGITYPFTGVP